MGIYRISEGILWMFYESSIGISVRILWGFNEIISIWISTMIQWYSKGVLFGIDGDCKGIHMDAVGCL